MNKDVKKLLVMFAFYSLSSGMLYNFQELWMGTNELSINSISLVYSICALLTVSTIFICSNILKAKYLRRFLSILMYSKVLLILLLFLLDTSGEKFLIKLLIMLDYVIDVELAISAYPLISIVEKSDKTFAKKGLIYSLFYYIGAILTAFLLGKSIGFIEISYNFYLLMAAISLLIAYIILRCVDVNKYLKKDNKEDSDALDKIVSIAKKDKITKNYLLYIFTGNISFYTINSLVLTLLVTNLSIEPSTASYLLLGLGILASIIGIIILSKLTLKNDYINIGIKFIGRMITYLLVVLFTHKVVILIAIIYTRVLSESYSHVTDAPYINRFDGDLQLAFCNLKEMVGYFSRAIGTYLCGFAITLDLRMAFLIAFVFVSIQIYFAYKSLRLRKEEGK